MTAMQRVVKPRTQKAKRALQAKEPKAIEDQKKTLFVKGMRCSNVVQGLLKDLAALKKPQVEVYTQKNDIRLFEDFSKMETYCYKTDSALFAFGSHTKKRPHNLTIGRTYDTHMLDMVEFGVDNFESFHSFKNEKVSSEIKPCILFSGEAFEKDDQMKRIKSLLIDFFRGPEVTNIRLGGLEHAIQVTCVDEGTKILIRSYKIVLKKSDNPDKPRVELEEIGPRIDLSVRRTHLASDDLFKTACKQVKNVYKKKKVKNISEDDFGSTLGRVHVKTQELNKLQTRKMKGLKEDRASRIKAKKEKAEQSRKKAVEEVFAE